MVRTLQIVVFVPLLALLGWLALGRAAPRADFVMTMNPPRTLDPHRVSWLYEIQLSAAMFEGLTRLHPETAEVEPAVAARWEVDAARTEYTFCLREDARWSTGEAVEAEDFRAAWLRVLDPRCAAQYATLLFVVEGAEAYYRARLNDDPADDVPADAVGVVARGPRVLEVRLARPCSYFLDITSFITLAPVHRATLARWAYRDGEVLGATEHLMMRPENVVCNGAFVLERWDFKQAIWLRRNPWYWERGAIGVDTIEAWIVSNPNAALLAYETGRADYVRGLERSVAQALMARGREDFHTGPRFATFFFRVNCQREPLVRADLRKALALAIDREAICDHVMRLCETPAWTFVPRSALHLMPRRDAAGEVVSYEPPAGLGAGRSRTECVALAREYLRRSGYDRETEGRPLEVAFAPGDPEQQAIAEAVQAMWERDLGIRVALRTQEATVLSTRILQLDYDLARSNWFGDYLDPSTFLEMFASESGQNRTGWAHAGYDALLAAAAAESDDRRRFALLREAERILCEEELPILPVFHRCGNYLLRPRFGGVGDNVRDLLAVHRVRRAE